MSDRLASTDFIDFASGASILNPDKFLKLIVNLWKRLENEATVATELVKADPTNDTLAADALEKAELFMAFGELMVCGNTMVNDYVHLVRIFAEQHPEAPGSDEIISLMDEFDLSDVTPAAHPKKGNGGLKN